MTVGSQNINPSNSDISNGRDLYKNPLSLVVMALALVAVLNILFLFFLDSFSHVSSPYVGILAYMVAPAFLILGLLLIPIGIIIERRRRHRAGAAVTKYGRLDLNNPAQRSALAFVLSFVVIFALL